MISKGVEVSPAGLGSEKYIRLGQYFPVGRFGNLMCRLGSENGPMDCSRLN